MLLIGTVKLVWAATEGFMPTPLGCAVVKMNSEGQENNWEGFLKPPNPPPTILTVGNDSVS